MFPAALRDEAERVAGPAPEAFWFEPFRAFPDSRVVSHAVQIEHRSSMRGKAIAAPLEFLTHECRHCRKERVEAPHLVHEPVCLLGLRFELGFAFRMDVQGMRHKDDVNGERDRRPQDV